MNIYVGNLPKTIAEATVREAFEAFGEVSEIKLIKERFTNELRGFGFVEMPSKKQGQEKDSCQQEMMQKVFLIFLIKAMKTFAKNGFRKEKNCLM